MLKSDHLLTSPWLLKVFLHRHPPGRGVLGTWVCSTLDYRVMCWGGSASLPLQPPLMAAAQGNVSTWSLFSVCYLLAENLGCFDQGPAGSRSVGVQEQRWADSFFPGAISWEAHHCRSRCRGCITFLLDYYSVWSHMIWLKIFYSVL